jgi:hypothetical protein
MEDRPVIGQTAHARGTRAPAGGRCSPRVWLGLLALVVVLAFGGCSAAAQNRYSPADTSADPYAAVRAQADEYYRQGLEHYRRGEFRRALESFESAKLYDPNPRPEVDDMIRRSREAIASGGMAAVVPAPTADATPVSRDGQLFVSRAYNYALTYPPGWRAEGATTRVGSTLLDLYAEEGDGAARALVFGFPTPVDASQDALVRESLALRQKMGTPYKRLGVRAVDAAQAVVVTYSEQREDGAWLAVRQAVFQQGGTCWVVAVTAPTTEGQRYWPVLDQMLDGFRVGPSRA